MTCPVRKGPVARKDKLHGATLIRAPGFLASAPSKAPPSELGASPHAVEFAIGSTTSIQSFAPERVISSRNSFAFIRTTKDTKVTKKCR